MRIRGIEHLPRRGSVLILPNHQAAVDPQILFTFFAPHRIVAPVVAQYVFDMPVLGTFLRAVGAVPIHDDRRVVDDARAAVCHALRSGAAVLIYPSGQTQGQGYEFIGGKRFAYDSMRCAPEDARIIAVRIQGLWGSVWSRAWSGRAADIPFVMVRSIWYILANVVFLVPRRTVTLTVSDITAKVRAAQNARAFNAQLEVFYNADGEEPARFVRHFWFAPRIRRTVPAHIDGSVAMLRSAGTNDACRAEDIAVVRDIIAHVTEGSVSERIMPQQSLAADLFLDSLQIAEVITRYCARMRCPVPQRLESVRTVADLCALPAANSSGVVAERLPRFLHGATSHTRIVPPQSNATIAQLCDRVARTVRSTWLYDPVRGSVDGRTFRLRAHVAAALLRTVTRRRRIGVMLPATQGAALLIVASHHVGKVPVMINWTAGARAIRHMIRCAEIDTIITARAFYDRIRDDFPTDAGARVVFIDDLIATLSLRTKMVGVLRSVLRICAARNPDDPAVILFTSGSESLPKAVPLTHRAILANIAGALRVITLYHDDVLLSTLPPFHSFGFTVGTILPLVTGLRAAFVPDPRDAALICAVAQEARATLLPTAPTFLRMIGDYAVQNAVTLAHLRIVLTGAEACPRSVRDALHTYAPHAMILEGYGATECAPVISVTPPGHAPDGSVGVALPHLTVRIVNPETHEECACDQDGMIVVRGESVFAGYMCSDSDPFITLSDGCRYYETGDIGHRDAHGNLFITARAKRFVKIGAEMVSLPAVEAVLNEAFGQQGDVPQLVVVDSGSEIVCVTTQAHSKSDYNRALRDSGMPAIVRIARVVRCDAIPLLGSGKIDYRAARKYAAS